MKSRIRSRWYRANEKPLESQNSSSIVSQTPIGEVSLSSDEFLKDDLNDEAAKKTHQEHFKYARRKVRIVCLYPLVHHLKANHRGM